MGDQVSDTNSFVDYEGALKAFDDDKLSTCSSLYFYAFLRLNKPLKDLYILDAGCMTGRYSLALLQAGVGHVTLMEGHQNLLEKGKERCKMYMESGRANAILCPLPKLPFEEGTFDCVMYNNVFHRQALSHSKYSFFQTIILEARRVLKPGGLLLLNMTFPNQYLNGYWYFHLAKHVMHYFAENQLTQDETVDMLKSSMLKDSQILVDTTALYIPKELYFDSEGPLNDSVRSADLFWGKLSDSEKGEVGKKVLNMRKAGTIKQYIKENDKERTKVGQMSLVLASKRMETTSPPLW